MPRFDIGDLVCFTCEREWITGGVVEIREGYKGNHLLVVRRGNPWTGDKYIVLSSYAEPVKTQAV